MVPPPDPDQKDRKGEFLGTLDRLAGEHRRTLTPEQAERLARHFLLLERWGRRMNLTGLKAIDAIIRRHFLEPLVAVDLLDAPGTLLDIGSGNGFPAIPLAILRPGIVPILVESSERKAEFLWAVLRETGLRKGRVEQRHVRTRRDLADLLPVRYLTFRAVRGGELLRGEGKPLLEQGGRLIAFVSEQDAEALRRVPPAGLRWIGSRPLACGEGSDVLALFEPGRGGIDVPRGTHGGVP